MEQITSKSNKKDTNGLVREKLDAAKPEKVPKSIKTITTTKSLKMD